MRQKIYITADHGFLYTYSPLSEDDKVDKTTVSSEDVEVDRRYLITMKGAKPDYLLPVKFFDENAGYDAFAPRESIRIKKSGSGLNFVHGWYQFAGDGCSCCGLHTCQHKV